MIKPLATLALVGACQSVPYRYYGMNLGRVPQEEVRRIEFYAAGNYPDLPGVECWHAQGATPRCYCMEVVEHETLVADYREAQKALEACEGSSSESVLRDYRYYGLRLVKLSPEAVRSVRFDPAGKYPPLNGVDCQTDPGASPRCVCMTESDQIALVADLRATQKRLDRCEDERKEQP